MLDKQQYNSNNTWNKLDNHLEIIRVSLKHNAYSVDTAERL